MSSDDRMQTRRRLIAAGVMAVLPLWADRGHTADTLKEDGFKGTQAPDWELKALDGRTWRLAGLKGRAVVLNFWALWCAPCRIESRWLSGIYKEYGPSGLEVLGASMDEPGDDGAVAEFAKKYAVNYPILLRGTSIADRYGGVRYLPQTFFVDRAGTIVRNTLGIKDEAGLRAEVSKLVQ